MIQVVKNPRFWNRSQPSIVQVFLDADLRGSHAALLKVGGKYGLDLLELKDNQFVVFINKKRTLMKCYVAGNTFSFTRAERIELAAISKLPQHFGYHGELNYDAAVRDVLEQKLARKKK